MKLVIVESPAKAKTISNYLGHDYNVMASVGHIRDLPKSNKKAIDIENGYHPFYEIVKGKEKIVSDIKKAARTADEVLLATDPDREGEAIAWHIVEACNIDNPKRVAFHEITKNAVVEAISHPRDIDMNLKEAQEARRVLDRLFGYELSGLIWKKLRYGLSAGRVQSPSLRILMEREKEIRAFIKEIFFVIKATVKGDEGDSFILTSQLEPKNEDVVKKILEIGNKSDWIVSDIKETKVNINARAPFITSTLQQAASNLLSFAPSRTMGIAQKLYEKGHITYMRTDSTNIGNDAKKQILSYIEKEFGRQYASNNVFATKSKNAQEAHEAIRPTNINKKSAGLTPEQKKLYELIRARTIASQMIPANVLRTKLIVSFSEKDMPIFYTNGSSIINPGWYLADPISRKADVELPRVVKGQKLELIKMDKEQKETQPLNRYSEAGLIKELEKRGIGRPSTYATIVRTLIDRGYVEKVGKTLFPTDTGDVVNQFLVDNFSHYISDSFTAEMEQGLDDISNGKRNYEKTLDEFYNPFHKKVESKENIEKITNLGVADPSIKCPKCGSKMIIKLGKGGKFLSCDTFPDCDGARTQDGHEFKTSESIGVDPKNGEKIYVLDGRFGPYLQLGEKSKENKKPRRASIPANTKPEDIKLDDALKYLSLPRELGINPDTGKMITASIGRFGPFIVHETDFRSLKEDDVYEIDLKRALEIFSQPKKRRGNRKIKDK